MFVVDICWMGGQVRKKPSNFSGKYGIGSSSLGNFM